MPFRWVESSALRGWEGLGLGGRREKEESEGREVEGAMAAPSLLCWSLVGEGARLLGMVVARARPMGWGAALGVEEPEPLPAGEEGVRGVREDGEEELA